MVELVVEVLMQVVLKEMVKEEVVVVLGALLQLETLWEP